ncbi:MAG TPA: DMT family transporter [Streptosporangiaceae bacterium]|nr:DMT family transporter [Streptosporangiaceae bacterium]
MTTNRRRAVAALIAAGLLWGTTVPMSKLALQWLQPGWLTAARFGLAAAILLCVAARSATSRAQVRAACTPLMLASGAIGYGGSVVLQNAGITRTSVTHAALLIGTTPVLVAIIAALWQRAVARPVAWVGFAVSLAGVVLVAGGGGGGASAVGDGLVILSLLLGATFTVAQGRLLRGRDPVAVTAVQFVGATLAALPFSAATEGLPAAPHGLSVVLITVALAAGTLLPFTLFAYGQSRVSPEVAGAFLNIEPLVGAVAGIVVFADPFGAAQAAGGAAIIGGIALSMLPLLRPARRGQPEPEPAPAPRPATPVIPDPAPAAARAAQAVPGAASAAARAAQAVPDPEPAAARAAPAVPGPVPAAVRAAPAVLGAVPAAVRAARATSEPVWAARSVSRVARSRAAAAPRSARLRRGFRHAPDLDLVHGDPHREHPCGPAAGLLSTFLMGEEDDREPLPAGCL